MSEEETTVQETTTETTSTYIDSEGNFTEGWQEKYVPEDLRGEAIFSRIKSMEGMTKTLANLERMKGSEVIPKPNDRYGDEDWDNYYKAAGWTGEPIKFDTPEGLPEGIWNEDRANKASEVFNQLRLTPQQQQGIMEFYNADLAQQLTDLQNNSETAIAELKAGLLSEWGNAYEQKKHLGNAAIEKGASDAEHKERLVQKFGNDPDFIRYAANIGGMFSESGAIAPVQLKDTPADIQSQIQDIMNSDAFMKPLHPEHANTMKRLRLLHIEKAKLSA